jgi:ribonuclease VapC
LILDASALIALLEEEPEAEEVERRLNTSKSVSVGAPTLVETAMVLAGRVRGDPSALIAEFLHDSNVAVIPFTEEHYRVAVQAFLRYGKGRHPAGLNMGDCLSYATAKLAGVPLLYVGNDFEKTDLAWKGYS